MQHHRWSFFNQLGRLNRIIQCHGVNEIEQVARIQQVIDRVATIFIKHQIHDLLGISLVHNHFQLNAGEIVQTGVLHGNSLIRCITHGYSIYVSIG